MARFNLNDQVRMLDTILTSYRGEVGTIVDVKPHRLNKETLDKYVVRFADGKTLLVWSIQLEPSERQNTAITIS